MAADRPRSGLPGKKAKQDAVDPAVEAFERWLKRGLEAHYGGALGEPISKELLEIIEADRKRREGGTE